MATLKIVIRKQKVNAAGLAPLALRITQHRQTKYISLGIRLDPKFWDEGNQRVRQTFPNSRKLNSFLKRQIAEIQTKTSETIEAEPFIATKEIVEAIKGKPVPDFFEVANRFIETYNSKGKVGTYRRYKSTAKKFAEFIGKRKLPMNQITVSLLKQYESHLRDFKQNKPNTIHSNMRIIRRVINIAIEEELFPYEKNPFIRFKMAREKSEKVYLTEQELMWMESVNLDTTPKRRAIRE